MHNLFNPNRLFYLLGLGLIAISLSIHIWGNRFSPDPIMQSPLSGIFFLNYILFLGYGLFLLVQHFAQPRPRAALHLGSLINLVVLFSISAFSLNTTMHVFAPFPLWLNIYTVCSLMLLLAFPYINQLPDVLKLLVYFLAGIAFVLFIYMACFLFPLLPLSIFASVFVGISLHSFVPFLWLWATIRLLFIRIERPRLKFVFIAGIFAPIVFVFVYLQEWKKTQVLITDILAEKNVQAANTLPDAVVLAQRLPDDELTEMIIVSPFKSQDFGSRFSLMETDRQELFHDPLAIIGNSMYGQINIDQPTAETLLNIRKDARHKTSRRLWTGINLSTASVSNNIEVFPAARMAYQEKIITIKNQPGKNPRAWFTRNTQEAVYSFHLPEGSIVTSLSLWINGKEEKSRLSTRQKADSAYTQIVGVESRDPALVHWQEGNRVTVTVFPCTPSEDRKFKIGFTTPMSFKGRQLVLQNVWFEGPDMNDAREYTQIHIADNGSAVQIPEHLEKKANGNYTYQGDYIPDWKMSFSAVTLSSAKFAFNGHTYSLNELKYDTIPLNAQDIYLDLMKDWTKQDYEEILRVFEGKNIYVWLPEKTKIKNDNKEAVWEQLSTYQFSLPYIYQVDSPQKSLVITKSGYRTPLISDLQNSNYASYTQKYLQEGKGKIKVINIGDELSPYWKTLHELRVINYAEGSVRGLENLLKKNSFYVAHEDSSTVALLQSRMSIIKQPATALELTTAPDHYLRLYAYNDVMRKAGKNYFDGQVYEDEIFREAEEGYVVTPVTSMIVLESLEDYKRMGIDENTNTVGNAGVLSGGAVPEPHEWALIGLVVLFIFWQWKKRNKTQHV